MGDLNIWDENGNFYYGKNPDKTIINKHHFNMIF